jgi:hypothetical protein
VCAIIDANQFSLAFSAPPDSRYVPLLRWLLDGGGALAYGGTKYASELGAHANAVAFFAERFRAGRAVRIPNDAVDAKTASLASQGQCESNDEHIIALALLSGARTICTQDEALTRDVRNPTLLSDPRGRVYRTAAHSHLLTHHRRCARPTAARIRRRRRRR